MGFIGLQKSFARANLASYAFWTVATAAAVVGCNYLEQNDRDRCSRFRDKSKMFGGNVKEGEAPSWGSPYKKIL